MRFILTLPLFLVAALAHAEADGVIRSLAELDAAIGDAAPRSDAFSIEGLVTQSASAVRDQFAVTDGVVHMMMTDGVFWPKLALRPGDRIRASGRVIRQTNAAYNYAKAFDIEIVSHGPPPPPIDASAATVNSGRLSNRIVRLNGTVIDAFPDEIDPRYIFFVVSSEGEIAYANAYCTSNPGRVSSMVGAKVSIVGICNMSHRESDSRHNLGMQLATSFPEGITIVRPASADPYCAPLLEGGIHDVRKALASDSPRRRVCGRVIAVWHGDSALLRTDGGSATRIRVADGAPPKIGDLIEAVGMPETDIHTLNLARAIWRRTGTVPPCGDAPEPISARTLLVDDRGRMKMKPGYHGRLISLRGVVQSASETRNGNSRLTLNDGGYDIPVELGFGDGAYADSFRNCKVEVAGICVMETETWRPQTPFPRILGFFIVPRSPADIKILAHPPWWTPGRLFAVIGALAAVLLSALVWNILLQKVSDRKGHELAAARFSKRESELKVGERTRLATDLHDSIVQNLTGASMKLRAADRMFETRHAESRRQLTLALMTLDSCREEIRNCIWDLRNQALDEPVIDKMLRRVLAPHIGAANLTVRFAVPRERLTDNSAHAIICIVRELVLNAVRHGRATSIQVAGCIDGDNVLFSVKDDGCGFDVESAPGADQGHFGLQGVRERIDALHGSLSIYSEPGRGSKVVCRIPQPR